MSQPRQPTPTQSPTPSKSSLRRTSSAQNPTQRSLIPPPSPHFEEQPAPPVRYSPRSPPNQTLEYESDEDDEPLIYPDIPTASGEDSYFPYPEPDRPFQPLFTLIEDGLTSEHYHPSVHYIFADDDAEIVTEAALRSLDQDDLGASSTTGDRPTRQSQLDSALQPESRLPPPAEGVREHYLILDVRPVSSAQAQQRQAASTQAHSPGPPQGQSQSQNAASQPDFLSSYAVTSFTSLSPDWQITSASITSAPTMGDAPGTGEDEALMLRIEGRGIPPSDDIELPASDRLGKGPAGQSDDRDTARAAGRESLEDMIEKFRARLGEVKRLIELDVDSGPLVGGGGGDAGYPSAREGLGFGLEEQD